MPERVAAIALALIAGPVAGAVGLTDPTRPPTHVPRPDTPAAAPAWRLSAIFLGPGRRARALIDGRLVGVGARVGGARVLAIEAHRVVLALPDGSRRTLRLVARPMRRPAAREAGSRRGEHP